MAWVAAGARASTLTASLAVVPRRRPVLPLLLAAIAACGPRTAPAPPAAAAPERAIPSAVAPLALPTGPAVNVRLTHAGADAWIVEYALPEPARALAFGRPRIAREGWRILEPPGATWVGPYVVASRPFRRLRIELPTSDAQPEKEYRPFYRYTDSGLLAYTGQLAVARAVCGAGDCAAGVGLSPGADYAAALTLVAAAGENVIVQGRPPAPAASVAMIGDGTYAYFGALAPVESPGFTGVVDRGLPGWLRDRVSADIPRLFALYADRLGPLDGPVATVFLTFTARAHGTSLGGGVLPPHLLTLDLELGGVRLTDNPATLLDVDRLVAHEAAHFWNDDQHAPGGDPGAAWLDEGSADALAARALHAAGVLDDTAYRDELSEAASECALWLSGGEPLTASTRPGHARAFYVCGSTLDLIVEAACQRGKPRVDLFSFWRAVFDEGKPVYDEATFLRVLGRLGGDPAVTEAVRRLVHEPVDEPTRAIRDALRLAGVETILAPPGQLPEAYEQHASIPEMDALLPRACADALTFDGDVEVRPGVGVEGACPGLSRGDVIDSVAGLPVGPRGASSFERAYASCRTRRAIDVVTARQARVTVPCDPKARAAPAYFAIVKAP